MDGCDHLDDVHFALENVSSPLTPPVTAHPCTAHPCPALPGLQSAQSRSFGWWLMRLVEPWNWRSDGSMRTSHLLLVSLFKNGVTSCLKEYVWFSNYYGNTGCGVFKRRVQHYKEFCLRINILKGNYWILRIGLTGSLRTCKNQSF